MRKLVATVAVGASVFAVYLATGGTVAGSYVRTGKTLPNGKPELRLVQGLANRRAEETAKCMAAVQ